MTAADGECAWAPLGLGQLGVEIGGLLAVAPSTRSGGRTIPVGRVNAQRREATGPYRGGWVAATGAARPPAGVARLTVASADCSSMLDLLLHADAQLALGQPD